LTPADEGSAEEFRTAILEIKAQAPYNEVFRGETVRSTARFKRASRDPRRGRPRGGEFHADIDPDETADFLVTLFHGAQTRAAAVDRPPERTRQYVHEYIDETLRPDEATERDTATTDVDGEAGE